MRVTGVGVAAAKRCPPKVGSVPVTPENVKACCVLHTQHSSVEEAGVV